MYQKIISFMMLLLLSFVLNKVSYGQESWIPFTGSTKSKPIFNLQHSTTEKVSFSVETTGMSVRDVAANDKKYQRLAIPDQTPYNEVGFPEIPVVSQLIAIPDCEQVILNIIPVDSIFLEDYNVYPVPKLVKKVSPDGYSYLEEEFAINDSVYSTDCYFPNVSAKIAEQGSIREQGVAGIAIYPVQFNPVTKILRVYTEIKIELKFVSPKSAVIKNVGPFYKACRAAILNYH